MTIHAIVTSKKQIKEGDKLLIIPKYGEVIRAKAKCIVGEEYEREEVVYNKKYNKYFNVDMLLTGQSWVLSVFIVKGN